MRLPLGIGLTLGAVGGVCVGVGIQARRDVRRALAEERITGVGGGVPAGTPVRTAATARALAEMIRESTVTATGGRTYAELPSYAGADGTPTSDASAALRDERTGGPVRNPDVDLWLQSTTLQSALMQAYMGFRLAEFTIAMGASLAAAGVGIAAAARTSSKRPVAG
jgi:hypothetical protein